MAWNDVGHGAEAVEFGQWRSALNGQEQYHGVLVGADGTPVPVYDEVKQIGAEFERVAPYLEGTTVDSQVAILQDYESRWAINWQRHNSSFDPVEALVSYYASLRALARSVDIVSDTARAEQVQTGGGSGAQPCEPEAAGILRTTCGAADTLVLTQRSAMKDQDKQPVSPAAARTAGGLLGARVEQWYALEQAGPHHGEWGAGEDHMWRTTGREFTGDHGAHALWQEHDGLAGNRRQ